MAALRVFSPRLPPVAHAHRPGLTQSELIPANTVFEDRIQQVDLRFARIFRIGKVRIEGNFDVYNLFNASPILSMITRFGPEWLNAQEILAGRLVRFGAQINF